MRNLSRLLAAYGFFTKKVPRLFTKSRLLCYNKNILTEPEGKPF